MQDIVISTNYSSTLPITDKITTFKVKNPMLSYFAPSTVGVDSVYKPHAYDLYEYGRILDVESFVCRAFNKKRTLMFKEGYEFTSENEKNAEYIAQRLNEIAYVSGQTFDGFIRETAANLITFHNAYIVKVRKLSSSSGKLRQIGNKTVEPIAAYFNLPPESIEVRVNQAGEPVYYRQKIKQGKYVEYTASQIIHLHYNKRTGFVMGTPPLEPVKDDILALRRIEESIETLIYKSLFPIIHVKVGTEKNPAKKYQDGTTEVDIATKYIDKMEDDGGIVTSERVDIKAIGAESLALRVNEYLGHFKERVFIGLGMSGIDFGVGDSTGRATGEVLSESLKESVIDYQYTLSEFITERIINELLCESGRYKIEYEIKEKDKVYFEFTSLDVPGKIKKESHELNKMTQGAIDINEARRKMGHKPKSPDELKNMAKELQYDPNKEAANETTKLGIKTSAATAERAQKAQAATAKAGHKAGQSTTVTTTKAKGKDGSSKLTKSITKPTNQHTKDSIEYKILNVLDSGNSFTHGRIFNIIIDDLKTIIDNDDILGLNYIQDSIAQSVHRLSSNRKFYTADDMIQNIATELFELAYKTSLLGDNT